MAPKGEDSNSEGRNMIDKCRIREPYPEYFTGPLPAALEEADKLDDSLDHIFAWITGDDFSNSKRQNRVAIRVEARCFGGADIRIYDGNGQLASFAVDVFDGIVQLAVDDLKADEAAAVRFPDPPTEDTTMAKNRSDLRPRAKKSEKTTPLIKNSTSVSDFEPALSTLVRQRGLRPVLNSIAAELRRIYASGGSVLIESGREHDVYDDYVEGEDLLTVARNLEADLF